MHRTAVADAVMEAFVIEGGQPLNGHVKAFAGQNDSLLASFYAFPGFYGKTSISGADFEAVDTSSLPHP